MSERMRMDDTIRGRMSEKTSANFISIHAFKCESHCAIHSHHHTHIII